jgi:hypothetical protein
MWASPQLYAARYLIVERMRDARLPAIYQFSEIAKEGGLLSMDRGFCFVTGMSSVSARHKAGRSPDRATDQVRAGGESQDRKRTRYAISPALLLRADEVIE